MIDVYTDGSCLGNPGPGGWAAVGGGIKMSGGQANTTNNAMEMTAVVMALEQCLARDILDIRLFTDSSYVKNGITKWVKNWKKNDWCKADGEPVKNKELWIEIDTLAQQMNCVEWHWVKAHNGHPQNELVDSLAREEATAIKGTNHKYYSVVKGYIPGIYTTWDEAKVQIHEYPGAVYKSFKTEAEAKEYMNTPVKERIYLDVPYEEKDIVKSNGAKWDPSKKKWWVYDTNPETEKYVHVN
jgi:ribonuclease HI